MKNKEQKEAAKLFIAEWGNTTSELEHGRSFWIALLRNVYGVSNAEKYISFEKRAGHSTCRLDMSISTTRVLIEQKSACVDLTKAYAHGGKTKLTPYQQALRYALDENTPVDELPRWVILCNFKEFHIYDRNKPKEGAQVLHLKDLPEEVHRLQFLVDIESGHVQKEKEVSIQAGELIGQIHSLIVKQYGPLTTNDDLRSANVLCVRLVFCMYAEDAGVFDKDLFYHYLSQFKACQLRDAIKNVFRILNTKDRNKFESPELLRFPFVNGGLFDDGDEVNEIPQMTEEIYDLLVRKACYETKWDKISPTIFGAVFESTLNPETRRKKGMHYTSVENIHKVIGPLFLDELKNELQMIEQETNIQKRHKQVDAFRRKLSSIVCFDPACGSGNFLTETYISLRRLENEALWIKGKGQYYHGELNNPIMVTINQFYGMEINDFAASVAATAMWIAESQMRKETENIVKELKEEFLPLKHSARIIQGNSLRRNWEFVVPKDKVTYIIGNPPFVGSDKKSDLQKEDLKKVYLDEKGKEYPMISKMDYVAGWFFKACQFMQGTSIRAAFVSTNSITQGEQVAGVWSPLITRFGVHIDFAWRSFVWNSEASDAAKVHCVIVGFSISGNNRKPRVYETGGYIELKHINPYLLDMEDILVTPKNKALCDVLRMRTGNRATDGGHLIIEEKEYARLTKKNHEVLPYIKKFIGGDEFINGMQRYCLWLVDADPSVLRKNRYISQRIELCRKERLSSTDSARRKLADTPWKFRETRNPKSYLCIPKVSSGNRKYIPIGFLNDEVIPSDLVFIVEEAPLFYFGILTSSVHMVWTKFTCGRLKSDYRYSNNIVYNNFPWPEVTLEQRTYVEELAQEILDARCDFPNCSLADLYDQKTMPISLQKAHKYLDDAVLKLYGFKSNVSELEIIKKLFRQYDKLREEAGKRKRTKKRGK